MSKKIPSFLKNGYLALALGTIIILSFFLVAEPVSLDRKYNGQSIKIAEETLKHINKFYLDKSKIDYAEMLEKAVSSLETFVDDVLVEFPQDGDNIFTVQVKEKTKRFGKKESPSANDVTSTLGDVVSFVLSNTGAEDRTVKNIEYSISDSMLKVLDPHSAMIPPDIYKEFLIDTEGSFGGLGIVVGIRDGQLTVISPIEGTPAYRSGIKTKDRIVQIENESTINMPLLEAVGKLRGKKGTRVNLLISRKNFSKPRKFSIVRDTIKIESVEGFDLENDILYLRIRNFQKNTSSDLKKEMKNRSYAIKGIILDLRGNPGGLLSEAEKVADLFLSSGTIMTTRARDYSKTYRATAKRPEYKGKVVVLVNQGSASASEIVAGALKNNKRAIVVGKRSFGKGSVQKVFEFDDGAALKLTIAKYFTPGDISIQDRGITPDILLQGSVITAEKIVYNPLPEKKENADDPDPLTPQLTIKYIDESLAPQEEEDEDETQPDESLTKAQKLEKLENDFYVKLSSSLLLARSRGQMYSIATGFSKTQSEKIRARIEDTGVDWSGGETKKTSVSVKTVPPKTVFHAGKENFLEIKVTNSGSEPIHRLSAVTDCENCIYGDEEFLFGKLLPGQSRNAKVKFSVPRWVATREDNISLVFTSSENKTFTEGNLLVKTVEDKRPVYSYNREVVDDGRFGSSGNGNGRAELEETVVLNVKLKNMGDGMSEKTVATLKNLSGDNIFLEKGRVELENFRPGETRSVPFRFRQNGEGGMAEFELLVMDEDFREVKTRKITLPVFGEERQFLPASAKKTAVFRNPGPIAGGSFPEASTVALAQENSTVKVLGTSGQWIRVEGKNSVSGWVEEKDIRVFRAGYDDPSGEGTDKNGAGGGQEISVLEETFEQPPFILISDFPISTEASKVTIEGSVRDTNRIQSVSVWREGDKIKLFTPQRNNFPLFFPLALEEGMNLFTIVAKDENGMTSRKTLTIRKDIS